MRHLKYQFELIRAIRNFFDEMAFIDVLTPPMVQNPGMETHIHPFEVIQRKTQQSTNLFLQTSPEFAMKELLSHKEFDKIFNISYCFRDEPVSEIHRPQFLMLEWYRKNEHYQKIMQDCEDLIKNIQNKFELATFEDFPRVSVQEIMQEFIKLDILNFLDKEELKLKIAKDFKDIPLPSSECSWDDYFFLLFLNKVEPHFKNYPYLLLYEFPAPLSALSTIKEDNPNVCERFEIYLSGVELCNCFNELTDYNEQKKRFEFQAQEKKELYGYDLPWPTDFLNVLNSGYPKSSGIALGIERLYYSLFKEKNPFYK